MGSIIKPSFPIINRTSPLAKGLVGCWSFFERGGTTLRDISGKENHGTLTNMDPATAWIKTLRGWGVNYDGSNDFIALPANFNFTTPFTVRVRVKFNDAATASQTIFGGNADFRFGIVYNYGGVTNLKLWVSSNGTSWNIANALAGTKIDYVSNQFYDIIFSWDGTTYKIYVNAIEDLSLSSTSGIYSTGGLGLRLGKWGTEWAWLAGSEDEAQVWSRALSARERATVYANPNAIYLLYKKWFWGKFILSPPVPPILSSPLNGAIDVSINPTLYWNASAGATSYRLQVSLNSGFTALIVDQGGITDLFYAVSGLANNTTYWWRVNASNLAGEGAWSTEWHFTTIALPPPPEEASFPKILYNSILVGAGLSATDTATGFDVLNIRDYRPYTWWQAASIGTKYIIIDCDVAKSADCLGIMGHNWGSTNAIVSLESSTDGITYTERIAGFVPTSDKAIMKKFTSASARYWRIKIIASSVIPKLAVAFLGVSLNFPYPPDVPYIPYTEKVEADTAQGKRGHLLGASLKFKSLDIDATFSNLERAWTINEFKLFWDNHGSKLLSFFYGWDLVNYPDWAFYVNCENMDFGLPMSVLQYIDSISLKMKGVSEF